MINEWLELLSTLIVTNKWFAPILALFAGILTSDTPCALSSVPLVIGYVGGTGENDTRKAFRLSLTLAIGMAITFTTLGAIASLLGRLMGNFEQILVSYFGYFNGINGTTNLGDLSVYSIYLFNFEG